MSITSNFLKFLFYTFPAFMFTSSGYLNAYISFFIIYSLFFFYLNKIKINIIILDYLIILFFLSCAVSSLLNFNQVEKFNIGGKEFNLEISAFTKSIFNFRFCFLYIIVRNILDKQLVNIKVLSVISLICTVLLSFDISLQHLTGFNIFNNPPFDGRYNGFFEHEAIAGGYIQKFFLISIICLFILKKKTDHFFAIILIINILGLGILLSLDRMPYLIFFFSIIILLMALKNYRIQLFISLIVATLAFQIFFSNYDIVKNRYLGLARALEIVKIAKLFTDNNSKFLISISKTNQDDEDLKHIYLRIFDAGYYIMLENPLLGTGLKSFSVVCAKLQNNNKKNFTCSTHPHNIYLEIAVNQGIVGLLLFLSFIVILINNIFSNIFFSQNKIEKKILSIFFFTILISELIPIRSYGSIFQTVNGSIFWFFLSIISSKHTLQRNRVIE
jgi:O-antigen ligase